MSSDSLVTVASPLGIPALRQHLYVAGIRHSCYSDTVPSMPSLNSLNSQYSLGIRVNAFLNIKKQHPMFCSSFVLVPIGFIYVVGGVEGMFLIKELLVIRSLLITNRKCYLGSPTIRFDLGGLDCQVQCYTYRKHVSEKEYSLSLNTKRKS